MDSYDKDEITFLLKLGNFLAKSYLFIGGPPKKDPNTVLGKLRLQLSINILFKEYNRTQNNRVLFLLGKCYQSLENHEEALNCFKTVWDAVPFSPILFKEISTSCLRLDKFEEGLQYAQREVSEYPDNPESKANLAFFLFKNDKLDEARQLIKQTYDAATENVFVQNIYGVILDNKAPSAI